MTASYPRNTLMSDTAVSSETVLYPKPQAALVSKFLLALRLHSGSHTAFVDSLESISRYIHTTLSTISTRFSQGVL